jgi:hypothetical protein
MWPPMWLSHEMLLWAEHCWNVAVQSAVQGAVQGAAPSTTGGKEVPPPNSVAAVAGRGVNSHGSSSSSTSTIDIISSSMFPGVLSHCVAARPSFMALPSLYQELVLGYRGRRCGYCGAKQDLPPLCLITGR